MKAYQELEQIFNKLYQIEHCQAMLGWDEAAMMPAGSGETRAKALSFLSLQHHQLLSDKHVGELLSAAKSEALNEWQSANLTWMNRDYTNTVCLPEQLVTALTESRIATEQAWRELREKNDWQSFIPYLEKTFELVKESAKIQAEAYELPVYDYLIDTYSPGLTRAIIDPIFNELKSFLPKKIDAIIAQQPEQEALTGHFPIEKQQALGKRVMTAIGFNHNQGRLDTSHHPFCGGVAKDVRITTRYNTDECFTSLLGICHETGHACYEQHLPDEWITQPVARALGMSLHESQSLLIEMQACRSQEFMHYLEKEMQEVFPEAGFTKEALYQNAIRVKKDFIRVDADEVTYPLHIILRYEIEKALFADEISIKDLPSVWNEKMQDYLGLSTEGNDKDGVMQDVHWPGAAFGYFPAYTIGSVIAAQLFATIKQQIPDVMQALQEGNFTSLQTWLTDNIHRWGSRKSMQQLMVDATGEALNAKYFLEHIETRYVS